MLINFIVILRQKFLDLLSGPLHEFAILPFDLVGCLELVSRVMNSALFVLTSQDPNRRVASNFLPRIQFFNSLRSEIEKFLGPAHTFCVGTLLELVQKGFVELSECIQFLVHLWLDWTTFCFHSLDVICETREEIYCSEANVDTGIVASSNGAIRFHFDCLVSLHPINDQSLFTCV
jgi:hypothetical protein